MFSSFGKKLGLNDQYKSCVRFMVEFGTESPLIWNWIDWTDTIGLQKFYSWTDTIGKKLVLSHYSKSFSFDQVQL